MLNLRTRLLVGYAYMMVLILLTAGSAAFGFFTISEAIDRILQENIPSISASVAILDALELQNSLAIDAFLTGEVLVDDFARADRDFAQAMKLAGDNVTIEGEKELLGEIQRRFEEFRKGREEALSLVANTRQPSPSSTEVFSLILDVRKEVSRLLDLNHQAITDAEQAARATALRTAGWLGFLITISLLSMAFLARALQRTVLVRLSEYKEVAESLLTGDITLRFEEGINDELGIIARQLNAALDARDESHAEMRGRINQEKQLVLGLLDYLEGKYLLLGLDGYLIAATITAFDGKTQKALQQWLVKERKPALQRFEEQKQAVELTNHINGQHLKARLLTARGRRPVGWLLWSGEPGTGQ